MSKTVAANSIAVEAKRNSFGSAVAETANKIEQRVRKSPRSTMVISVGAGIGFGLLLGSMLGRSGQQSSSWFDREAADRIGDRLTSKLSGWIPDSLSDRF